MSSLDLAPARQAARLLASGCVVIDVETTASPHDPEAGIVEAALIDQAGAVLLNTPVKPRRAVSRTAAAIHGLTHEALAGAPSFTRIYPQLAAGLNGRAVVAYGADAEQALLERVCRRYRLPRLAPSAWHDAARLYAAYRRSDDFYKLVVACAQEGIPVTAAHRALDDCRLTLALLRAMAEAVESA